MHRDVTGQGPCTASAHRADARRPAGGSVRLLSSLPPAAGVAEQSFRAGRRARPQPVAHIYRQLRRPSAARGSGSPATVRRSRAMSIRPLFTASYKAPCPRRCSGASDSPVSVLTVPSAHSSESASPNSASARAVRQPYSCARKAASCPVAPIPEPSPRRPLDLGVLPCHAVRHGHRLHPGLFGRNPKMFTRWPSQITATRRTRSTILGKAGQPRLDGKLSLRHQSRSASLTTRHVRALLGPGEHA